MSGLSLQDLSDKLNGSLSKQALNRLESGMQSPDRKNLFQLCQQLNRTLDYFSKESPFILYQSEFRKVKNLSVKEQERIQTLTADYLERNIELENLLSITAKSPFEFRAYVIKGLADIKGAVTKVRELLKIGNDPIFNCVELLEENNIKVYCINTDLSFSGMSTVIKNEIGVIVYNDHPDIPLVNKRFTVLQELAHLCLDIKGFEEKQRKQFCDAFAGSLLLPDEKLKGYFGGKRTTVYTCELQLIKNKYGISLSAIMHRAKELRLISECCMKYFMIRYNKSLKKLEKDGYGGQEESTRFIQLLLRAIAQDIISTTKAAALQNMSLGDFRAKFLDIYT